LILSFAGAVTPFVCDFELFAAACFFVELVFLAPILFMLRWQKVWVRYHVDK